MSNQDSSQYTLRYNDVTQELEAAYGNQWTPVTVTNPGSGITQLTGDITAGPGSGSQVATLGTVNPDVGSFTNANITVNAKGLVTAATNGSGSSVTPNVQVNNNPQVTDNNASTNSFISTGNTITITPSSVSAVILLNAVISAQLISAGGTDDTYVFTIFQDSTAAAGSPVTDGSNLGVGGGIAEINLHGTDTFTITNIPLLVTNVTGDTNPHNYAIAVKAASAGGSTIEVGGQFSFVAYEIH